MVIESVSDPSVRAVTAIALDDLKNHTIRMLESPGRIRLDATDLGFDVPLEFDRFFAEENYGRARAIGEAIGLLEGAPGAVDRGRDGRWSLSIPPFGPWRRYLRVMLVLPIAVLLFPTLFVCIDRPALLFGGVGARCTGDSDCRGEFCLQALAGPGICSMKCSSEGDCPSGLQCLDGRACAPIGHGQFGAACRADWECKSGDCYRPESRPPFCTVSCDEGTPCPPASQCAEGLCVPGEMPNERGK